MTRMQPIDSQKFLISVATGQTKTLSSSTTISGTVTYTSGVSAEIKSVVNLSLTSSVSGTVSHTWGTTDVYTGPSIRRKYSFRLDLLNLRGSLNCKTVRLRKISIRLTSI